MICPRRVGRTQRSRCSLGAVGDEDRQRPGAHPEVRAHDAGRRHLLVDDQLLDSGGVATERRRPVRTDQPGVDDGPALVVTLAAGDVGDERRAARRARRTPRRGRSVASERRTPRRASSTTSSTKPSDPPSSWRVAVARFRYRWASCSQVKPMPPSSWMQSLADCTAPSVISAAATDVARAAWSSSVPAARAASQPNASICSLRTSMSARRCLTAWNWPMGRPNCRRTLAYSEAVSRHQRAAPASSAVNRTAASWRTRPVDSDGN